MMPMMPLRREAIALVTTKCVQAPSYREARPPGPSHPQSSRRSCRPGQKPGGSDQHSRPFSDLVDPIAIRVDPEIPNSEPVALITRSRSRPDANFVG